MRQNSIHPFSGLVLRPVMLCGVLIASQTGAVAFAQCPEPSPSAPGTTFQFPNLPFQVSGVEFSTFGGFGSATPSPTSDVAVADFDDDGELDLIVCGGRDTLNFPQAVTVLRGNPGASQTSDLFVLQPFFEVTDWPIGLAVGNFDADSYPDVAIAERATGPGNVARRISVFLNDGAGNFSFTEETTSAPYSLGSEPLDLETEDLDGDGNLDLISPGEDGITVLFGNGDGTFTFGAVLTPGARSVDFGLIDGDSGVDIVSNTHLFTNLDGTGLILDRNVDGNIDFLDAIDFFNDAESGDPSADVDDTPGITFSDGVFYITALEANAGGTQVAGAVYGEGTELFTGTPLKNPWDLAVGDLNGDSIPDLAVVHEFGPDLDNDFRQGASVLLGIGDGTFAPPSYNTTIIASVDEQTGIFTIEQLPTDMADPTSVEIADLTGDLIPDLAVSNAQNNKHAFLIFVGLDDNNDGRGDGTYASPSCVQGTFKTRCFSSAGGSSSGAELSDLALADFDNDGDIDVVGVGSEGGDQDVTLYDNGCVN